MPLRRALVLAAGLFPAAAAAAQEPAASPRELERLAGEQQQLAEQARRLESLLANLEQRDRAAGNSARADLLAGARERLNQAGSSGELALALEVIASELSAQRAGMALDSQRSIIQLLQDVLNFLLQQELSDQLDTLRQEAARRSEALEAFARQQEALLAQTQEWQESAQAQAGGPTAQSAAEREQRQREQEAAAAEQQALSQEVRQFSEQEQREGRDARNLRQAASAGEEAAEALAPERAEEQARESTSEEHGESREQEPSRQQDARQQQQGAQQQQQQSGQQDQQQQAQEQRPSPQSGSQQQQPRLEEAERRQEEALERLREAAEAARREQEQLDQMQELADVIDVMQEATALLQRHESVMTPYLAIAVQLGEEPLARAERGRFRAWSSEELAIGEDASQLNLEVLERGADTFPFLLSSLRQDHERFGRRLGPDGGYRTDASQVLLGQQVPRNWTQLIEALEAEAERLRRQAQEPQQGPEQQQQQQPEEESPLVSLAGELELLKRLQQDQRDSVQAVQARRQLLAERGFQLDEDDLEELDELVERQARLRRLYEAILERLLEESGQQPASGDADAKPEGV